MKKLSSSHIIAQYSELIREWAIDNQKSMLECCELIKEHTGFECSYSVMRYTFDKLLITKTRREERERIRRAKEIDIEEEELEEDEYQIPIEDLIQQRINATNRKIKKFGKTHYRNVKLPAEPIGLIIFGDPHVDSEACNWSLLYEHVKLCQQTEGVLGVSVGDHLDSWIGRLGKEYSKASLTASDGWRLTEWFFKSLQWLCIIGGNHDLWNDANGYSPIENLTRQCGVKFYAPDELRISIEWSKRPDLDDIHLYFRHYFKGNSIYHASHAANRESIWDGKSNLLAAGHIHSWAYLMTEMRHGRISHAISVKGYKRVDGYAKSKGFHIQEHGSACFAVIDPFAQEPARIKIFWNIEDGCDYLTEIRNKRKQEAEQ